MTIRKAVSRALRAAAALASMLLALGTLDAGPASAAGANQINRDGLSQRGAGRQQIRKNIDMKKSTPTRLVCRFRNKPQVRNRWRLAPGA